MLLNVEVENIRVNNPAPKPQIVVQSESGATKSSSQLSSEKVTGRNSLCPCGSGKKYKNCCGKIPDNVFVMTTIFLGEANGKLFGISVIC